MANLDVFKNELNYLWPLKAESDGKHCLFSDLPLDHKKVTSLEDQANQLFSRIELALSMAELPGKNLSEIHLVVSGEFDKEKRKHILSLHHTKVKEKISPRAKIKVHWHQNPEQNGVLVRIPQFIAKDV